jgi:hypothetical protein
MASKRDASRQKAAARRARQREKKAERQRKEDEAQGEQDAGNRQQADLKGALAQQPVVVQKDTTEVSTVQPQSASFNAQPALVSAGQSNKSRAKRQRNKLKAANRTAKAAAEATPGASTNKVEERLSEQ